MHDKFKKIIITALNELAQQKWICKIKVFYSLRGSGVHSIYAGGAGSGKRKQREEKWDS